MPSLAFLLPDPRLWPKDEVVIYTPAKNYTAHDYKELFFDIGFPEGNVSHLPLSQKVKFKSFKITLLRTSFLSQL